MKLKRSLFTLLFLCCSAVLATAQVATIPFEFQKTHFFIKVTTAKSDTLHFIFDTGSTGTTIDSLTAEKAGVDKLNRSTVFVDSYAGTKRQIMAIGQQLKIKDLELKDIGLVFNDLSWLSETVGRKVDGIIGYDVLSRYVTQLDFDHKNIILFDQISAVDTTGYTGIPFEFKRGVMIPRFPVTIALANGSSYTGQVMFDTGNAYPLLVNSSFSNFHKLNTSIGKTYSSNVNGAKALVGTIKSLSFSGFDLGKMDVRLMVDDKAAPSATSLGGMGIEIIKRFNVILDYTNKKLYFKPNQTFNAAFDYEEDRQKFKQENIAFLEKNKKKPGVKITPSGLQYKVIRQGKGRKPLLSEVVAMHFTIKLITGEKIYNTYDGKEPWKHELNKAIPGVMEAAQLMPLGSKWILYIPASLALGEAGYEVIPPHATLIYEVELIN